MRTRKLQGPPGNELGGPLVLAAAASPPNHMSQSRWFEIELGMGRSQQELQETVDEKEEFNGTP
jgi:hypothetical protein